MMVVSTLFGAITAGAAGGGVLAAGAAASGALTAGQGLMAAFSAISSGVSAVSSYQQGQFEQKMAAINMRGEELNSRAKAVEIKDNMLKTAAAQQVGFAGSGIRLDSGAVLDITNQTFEQGEYDVEMNNLNSDSRQAQIGYQGQQAANRGTTQAFGTLVKAGGGLYKNLYQINKRG